MFKPAGRFHYAVLARGVSVEFCRSFVHGTRGLARELLILRAKSSSAMPRTKLTGFSRLLIFLLIFLPLAYFGASYYNGEDPIGQIKELFGGGSSGGDDYNNHRPESSAADRPATFENVAEMRQEITQLRRDLIDVEEKLARCKAANVD